MRESGIQKGDRVGIIISDTYQHLLAMLALISLDCSQFAVSATDAESTHEEIMKRLKPCRRIVDRDERESDCLLLQINTVDSVPPGRVFESQDHPVGALIFSSSGTTGDPKLISYPHARSPEWLYLDMVPGAVFYQSLPLHFNIARRQVLRVLASGGTLVDGSRRGIDAFLLLQRKFKVTPD